MAQSWTAQSCTCGEMDYQGAEASLSSASSVRKANMELKPCCTRVEAIGQLIKCILDVDSLFARKKTRTSRMSVGYVRQLYPGCGEQESSEILEAGKGTPSIHLIFH